MTNFNLKLMKHNKMNFTNLNIKDFIDYIITFEY